MTAMTSGRLEPLLLIQALLGSIQERGRVTLLLSRIFYGVIPLKRPDAKRLLWTGQPEIDLD